MKVSISAFTNFSACVGLAAVMLAPASAAFAQPPLDNKYEVGETTTDTPKSDAPAPGVRIAKFDYVSGDVTWRPDANANWKQAKGGTAVNPGAQIWAVGSGKAEVRFEDGSVVRFGHDAIATLQTMYSDDKGGFTKITFSSGVGWLTLKSDKTVFEADLPAASVVAFGPARVRLGAESRSDIAVRSGKAVVQTKKASTKKVTINAGGFAAISTDEADVAIKNLPHPDGWDRFNDERDHIGPGGYARSGYGGAVFVPGPTVIFGGGFGGGWRRRW